MPVLHGMLATGVKLTNKYVAHATNIAHINLSPNHSPHVHYVVWWGGCDQGISSEGMVEKEKQRDMMKPGDGDVRYVNIGWVESSLF